MGGRIRLDLERLQGLPIDLPSRLSLWRALWIHRGSPPGSLGAPEAEALGRELRHLLLADQLSRCRDLAQRGHWCDVAERLASLRDEAEALGLSDALAQLLQELLEPLQRRLLASEGAAPSSGDTGGADLHADERAELLWQAHSWQQLLLERDLVANGHGAGLSELAEPIARLGAIAWLEHFQRAHEPVQRLQALVRSQALLIVLAEAHQPCPDWVELALRNGLRAGLIWLGRGLEPAELLHWSQALIASVLPEPQREKARHKLWPAEAALEVGRALRLGSFQEKP